MEIVLQLLELLGPAIAGLLTVPILNLIKKLVTVIDGTPAIVKQLLAVAISFALVKLGGLLNLALPESLSLFTGSDIEALVSAAIAMAVHAGSKTST